MAKERLEDFGPYVILRSIAVGGMAEIYLARQRAIEGVERSVVLKRILQKYADDIEFITMFLDEARLMAALTHPNIAQVFEVGKVEGSYYLAMEYVRGPTLGHLLGAAKKTDEGPLPRREALGIALSIAEALAFVHERRDEVGRPLNIVHRDLNPANVMVSYDGAIKLIDFGIAKAATKVYETRSGVIKGTYGYIAPEQLVGTTPVDRRADVFALGILLYEMVVGQHPYDVSDEPNLIDRILEARYRRPRDVRSDVPRDLDRLIASCLAPHPEGRPDDMGEVIDAIARHLGEQGQVPTLSRIAKLARRLVPDQEGPRPVRPLTRREYRRPFGNEPSGTKRLPIGGEEPKETTEPRPSQPPSVPQWSASPIDDDEPLTIAEDPLDGRISTDSLIHSPDADSDIRTLHHKLSDFPLASEEVEDAQTRLMPLADEPPSLESERPPRRRTPTSNRPPADELDDEEEGGGSGLIYAALGLGTLAALGLLAFGIIRFIDAERRTQEVAVEPRPAPTDAEPAAADGAPEALTLRVISQPEGATVYLDGEVVEGTTPLTATLPEGSQQVWLRIVREGYFAQERQVVATVGDARFVLEAIETEPDAGGPEDGGATDAAAGDEDSEEPAGRRRRRGRRRRGR